MEPGEHDNTMATVLDEHIARTCYLGDLLWLLVAGCGEVVEEGKSKPVILKDLFKK